MRTSDRLAVALVAVLAAAVVAVNPVAALAPAQAAPPAQPLESYQIMTYNVQDLPTIADHQDPYGIPDDKRMELLGDRLAAGGTDVVAFNELMGDDSEILLERLKAAGYKTILDEFDSNGDLVDSGLGLASKWDIVPTVTTPANADECYYWKNAKCQAAFHMYTTGGGFDDVSSKGVAFTRLRNPATGLALGVFFTHLQASDGSDAENENQAIRGQQISEALQFAQEWANPAEDNVFMGDLNIRGDSGEYGAQILNNFGAAGYRDAFRLHGSPADAGFTRDRDRNSVLHGTGGERLDYILYRPRNQGSMCFQHTRVVRDLRWEGTYGDAYINTDLSDHYPLAATVAAPALYCRPDAAQTGPTDGEQNLTLAKRGGYVWLRYGTPGTYSFKAQNPHQALEVQAYRDTDLSEPIASWAGGNTLVTQSGERYSNTVTFDENAPFYLRIRAVSPGTPAVQSPWTGTFAFTSHLHQGLTFDDAVVLDPFERVTQAQMSTQVANPASTVHYALKQQRLYTGSKQRLTFETSYHTLAAYRITVFDAARQPLPGLQSPYEHVAAAVEATPQASPISGEAQTLYFTVDRLGCEGTCLSTYDVWWSTDYRRIDLSQFHVADLNDVPETSENDEPSLMVSVDGGPETEIYIGTIDQDGGRALPAWARSIGFTTSVTLKAWENDKDISDPSPAVTIAAANLPFDTTDPYHALVDLYPYGDGDPSLQDGKYTVWYKACRNVAGC